MRYEISLAHEAALFFFSPTSAGIPTGSASSRAEESTLRASCSASRERVAMIRAMMRRGDVVAHGHP